MSCTRYYITWMPKIMVNNLKCISYTGVFFIIRLAFFKESLFFCLNCFCPTRLIFYYTFSLCWFFWRFPSSHDGCRYNQDQYHGKLHLHLVVGWCPAVSVREGRCCLKSQYGGNWSTRRWNRYRWLCKMVSLCSEGQCISVWRDRIGQVLEQV